MDLQINKNTPTIMHVDLNSCFATVEQQAYPHLRGKPIVIAAYTSPGGCVLAPSIEAKKFGIKTGMTVRDARLLYKDIIVRDPDPQLVRDVHIKFVKIFRDYSPLIYPKSIDEVVIEFNGAPAFKKGLKNIGYEIKERLKSEVGEWMLCNIGIGTNRFLAKLASSLHKPDGLDIIDYRNLLDIYSSVSLVDLHGINVRYEARLNANGIFNPIQFLNAGENFLHKSVFKSIVGHYWYLRLRGWEVDDAEITRKSFGQDFALGKKTSDPIELSRILMKLCEKMGRRLRRADNEAFGIHLGLSYEGWGYWHKSKKFKSSAYTTDELFRRAMLIFNMQPEKKTIVKISVSCFELVLAKSAQINLFDLQDKKRKVSEVMDEINDRYGEFVITPALMMNMDKLVLDRIAFGSVSELNS
ncbi:MAG: hypothetical protein WEC80_00525 [Patescibacteria group bacterium]